MCTDKFFFFITLTDIEDNQAFEWNKFYVA